MREDECTLRLATVPERAVWAKATAEHMLSQKPDSYVELANANLPEARV
jgi:hypothetical protein